MKFAVAVHFNTLANLASKCSSSELVGVDAWRGIWEGEAGREEEGEAGAAGREEGEGEGRGESKTR